jgi:hypothetical protein
MGNYLDCEHDIQQTYVCSKCGTKVCKVCEKKKGPHTCRPEMKGK